MKAVTLNAAWQAGLILCLVATVLFTGNCEIQESTGRTNILFPVLNFSSFTEINDASKFSSKYLSTISYK